LLEHWTWPVVPVDVSWDTFVTAVSSIGLMIADRAQDLARRAGEGSDEAIHRFVAWS
jgi:hypothetical protein